MVEKLQQRQPTSFTANITIHNLNQTLGSLTALSSLESRSFRRYGGLY